MRSFLALIALTMVVAPARAAESYKAGSPVPAAIVALAKCTVPGTWIFGVDVRVRHMPITRNPGGAITGGETIIMPLHRKQPGKTTLMIQGSSGCTFNPATLDVRWPGSRTPSTTMK